MSSVVHLCSSFSYLELVSFDARDSIRTIRMQVLFMFVRWSVSVFCVSIVGYVIVAHRALHRLSSFLEAESIRDISSHADDGV